MAIGWVFSNPNDPNFQPNSPLKIVWKRRIALHSYRKNDWEMKMAAVTPHNKLRGAQIHTKWFVVVGRTNVITSSTKLRIVDDDWWRRRRRRTQTIPKYITPSSNEVRYDETRRFFFSASLCSLEQKRLSVCTCVWEYRPFLIEWRIKRQISRKREGERER